MIEIICKDTRDTYNIYHLIKAFFPSEEVSQKVDENGTDPVRICLPDGRVLRVPEENSADRGAGEKARRHRAEQRLYRELEHTAGHSLSWGLLTGVRPTKLAMHKLKEGMDEENFVRWFQKESLVSEEKARLAWEVAKREKGLLDRLDYKDGYSLYVGIPFCPSVCTYCSFSSGSLTQWEDFVEDYLTALCRELRYIGSVSGAKKLNTIYVGGGTPTTLTPAQLERLLSCIDETFSREDLLEYTVEAGRPDSITREKLSVLHRHKVTRISINPQTMQQKTLDIIGRRHTVEEVGEAYRMARETGFDNINMDLIAGLPGETTEDMADTLAQIEALAPDSLTVHSLAIKRAAPMGQEKSMKGYVAALEEGADHMAETLSQMIRMAQESARGMGLAPYYLYRQKNIAGNFENVGYAKVDKAGIYNILIMEEKQSIIAAGAGASTKIVLDHPMRIPGSKNKKETNLVRIENVKAIDAYIARINEMIERKGEWLWR